MAEFENIETTKERRQSGDRELEIENVCTFYGEAQALKNVFLSVNTNEIVAILGSNGAGKTTLLRTITGLLTPAYGKILFRGESIEGMLPSEIIRKGIVSVPEGRELFGPMSVLDNLLLGAYSIHRRERREITPARLKMVFALFPILREKIKQRTETLSGGQQQMVAVGRALMANPKLLALDEPSLGLSPLLTMEMLNLLKRICHESGVSILLIEQNAKAALKIADYVYVLERGALLLEGSDKAIMANPKMQSAYLGG
jgi:branched-chain amino acid transport system ATP-binding protein